MATALSRRRKRYAKAPALVGRPIGNSYGAAPAGTVQGGSTGQHAVNSPASGGGTTTRSNAPSPASIATTVGYTAAATGVGAAHPSRRRAPSVASLTPITPPSRAVSPIAPIASAVAQGLHIATNSHAQQALVNAQTAQIWKQAGGAGPAPKVEITPPPVQMPTAHDRRFGRPPTTTTGIEASARGLSVSRNAAIALASPNVQARRATRAALTAAVHHVQAAKAGRRQQAVHRLLSGRTTLPGLTPGQTQIASQILRTGNKADANRKELLSAVETGLVESNLANLPGGDADSAGWRQERSSLYPDPTNVIDAAQRYFSETASAGSGAGISAGTLAANVQRPAEQYRGRYDEVKAQAAPVLQAWLKATGGQSGGTPQPQTQQLGGPYDGSREMVRTIFGAPGLRGDHGGTPFGEAPGVHAPNGDHYRSDGYAQDINGANPRENEPPFTQATLDTVVTNLRKLGATGVPDLTIGGAGWEGDVQGYRVFVEGGTSDHIHVGAHPVDSAAVPGSVTLSGGVTAPTAAGVGAAVGGSSTIANVAGPALRNAGQRRQRGAPASLVPLQSPLGSGVPWATADFSAAADALASASSATAARDAKVQAIMQRAGIA